MVTGTGLRRGRHCHRVGRTRRGRHGPRRGAQLQQHRPRGADAAHRPGHRRGPAGAGRAVRQAAPHHLDGHTRIASHHAVARKPPGGPLRELARGAHHLSGPAALPAVAPPRHPRRHLPAAPYPRGRVSKPSPATWSIPTRGGTATTWPTTPPRLPSFTAPPAAAPGCGLSPATATATSTRCTTTPIGGLPATAQAERGPVRIETKVDDTSTEAASRPCRRRPGAGPLPPTHHLLAKPPTGIREQHNGHAVWRWTTP